jgi:60 kDa SS-A/Ro ribonucleoprotein
MSRFNEKKPSNITTNYAGGIAYKHSPEMELVVSCLTTFLEDKFYESGDTRIQRIKELIKKVKPEFVAKLAILARKEFHLRSVVHLLVAELSRIHRGDSLISKTIVKIAERPDDLIEIVAYLGKPLPNQVKKGIRKALLNFDRYQLAKYRLENHKTKLVDLFNLTHPKPLTKQQEQDWKDLIYGKLKNVDTWEARLSTEKDKAKVWRELVLEEKIGYMALLRNLRNIDEQADEETKRKACEIISNRERVRASKQLPFRFYTAYENVSNQEMLEAISQALDYSLENVPTFNGKTLIAVDVSGSMEGEPAKIASLFAGALMKKNDCDVVLYNDSIFQFKFLKSEPVLTIAQRIQSEVGGGTNTGLVFNWIIQNKKQYDRIIILSDNESWQETIYYELKGTQEVFKNYKNETNQNPFIYAIDIQGYGTKDIKGDRVFHIAGWSEKIFDFIKWIEKENQLVDFVNSVEI